jgi:hypothetical protein
MDTIAQIIVVRHKKEEVLPVFMKSREMFYFFTTKGDAIVIEQMSNARFACRDAK